MSSGQSKQQQEDKDKDARPLDPVESEWGETPEHHVGYASDEERLAKRGLEDWELVDRIPDSQRGVPVWFVAVIVMVLLVAIGLSFPFWGDRPGYERDWVNWGFAAAIVYLLIFGSFVYFMVSLYGSRWAGRLDTDKRGEQDKNDAAPTTKKGDGDAS